jgi:L-2-hydroxyglutarate oxidase LhgO
MAAMIAAQCSGLFMGSGVRSPPTRSAVSMNSGITKGQVHNEGGAYVGGYWVPIEESHKINIEGGSNEGAQPAVRSATSHTSAKADGTYDVAIIGAGCIGAAVARELSKTMASVVLLEGADDVCQGATKGNSGIVHAGYDDKPGSTRARLCWKGNQLFPALDEDLHFGYQLTGSLVVARGAKEEEHLQELYQRGQTNGVKNLRIVGTEELRQMEPTLDEECTAALLSPDAGTLIPYEYTIALAENAADNGVEVRTRRMTKGITRNAEGLIEVSMDHWEPKEWVEQQAGLGNYFGGEGEGGPWENFPQLLKQKQKVTVEDMKVGGSGSMRAMGGVTVGSETIKARYVVNCAGGASDKIANMVGDESFKIKPRLGEYVLLKKSSGNQCNHILFPCPGPYGKGILVQKTLWGNLILGPTARDVHEWPNPDVDPDSKDDILQTILQGCRRLVPTFDVADSFHSFSGARAKSSRGDWIIERCATEENLIHAAGIDSPGIAGSPAIALEVVGLLEAAGLELTPDPSFNPKRAPVIFPKKGDLLASGAELVYTPDDKESVNPLGVAPELNVVCKCEKVTEAEVVEACRRGLPVDSTQAIRKRTRAGMGGCQGKPWNYGCECRVAQIVAREQRTQLPTAAVGRRPWSATSSFPRRWLTDADKAHLESLAPMTPAEEAKEALKEKGIVAPEPVLAETQAEETLMQKIKSALPFIGGKVKKD